MRHVAVILAGGSGTRLWPLSRTARPKQLLRILGGRSLLREAFERLRRSIEATDIYVVTLASHAAAVAEELPELPAANIIGEPMGRDTAAAIALAAAILDEKNPDTVMGAFTADHHIRPVESFTADLRTAFETVKAHPEALVTFGIKPTEPHTGFGYIERGEGVTKGVYRVNAFREKPDHDTAVQYAASGRHYWNSGMFVWRTHTILEQLERRLPDTHAAARALARQWATPGGFAEAQRVYPTLTRISIDFAVMEHAPEVLVVEGHFEWHDIGNWTALANILVADGAQNVAAAENAMFMDTRNTIAVAEDGHLIAALGVDDLVIVHSPDATLVCRRDQVQKIRDLVAELERKYGGRFT